MIHWQKLKQSMLARPYAACLLDATGKVIAANENWCRGGRDGGGILALAAPGTDYFAYCHQVADLGFEPARAFAGALEQVFAGRRARECLHYSHRAADRISRFLVEAALNRDPGPYQVVLIHRRLE